MAADLALNSNHEPEVGAWFFALALAFGVRPRHAANRQDHRPTVGHGLNDGLAKPIQATDREDVGQAFEPVGKRRLATGGVAKMLEHIDYWKKAPVWTPQSIEKATKTWFEFLEPAKSA